MLEIVLGPGSEYLPSKILKSVKEEIVLSTKWSYILRLGHYLKVSTTEKH